MARVTVEPGLGVNCEVTDYLWPWTKAVPVLMMHGFSRNASVWERWIPFVSEEHRVYRPDLRGCGSSDRPPEPYAPDQALLKADALEILDTMGLERVHWVGESAGGFLGILMAVAHPERFASLVLCDTPLRLTSFVRGEYSVGESSTGAAIRKLGVAEWCRRTLHYRLDLERAGPELADWYVAQLAKTPAYVSAATFECFQTIDIEPLLREITVPVLLLYGDKSKPASPEQQAILRKELPRAELRVFEGYGHGLNVLAPEACARAAVEFWKKIEAAEPNKTG